MLLNPTSIRARRCVSTDLYTIGYFANIITILQKRIVDFGYVII